MLLQHFMAHKELLKNCSFLNVFHMEIGSQKKVFKCSSSHLYASKVFKVPLFFANFPRNGTSKKLKAVSLKFWFGETGSTFTNQSLFT